MEFNAGFTFVEFLLFIILGLLFVWIATLEWRFLRATRTLRKLFSGRGGADLEQVLRDYLQRMDRTDQAVNTLGTRLDQTIAGLAARLDQSVGALGARASQLEAQAPSNVQHVGVVRYNPFPDKGGDQSFAVALLDDHADGVVLNGLHSRSDSRVYAKPIVGGASTYPLTAEEKEAITRALKKKADA
jgi:Protein of unknown function (DUF4446)